MRFLLNTSNKKELITYILFFYFCIFNQDIIIVSNIGVMFLLLLLKMYKQRATIDYLLILWIGISKMSYIYDVHVTTHR